MSSGSRRTPISKSNSYTSATSKLCGHGIASLLLTSTTDENPERRICRCLFFKDDDCGYFEWIDPELPPFQRGCFVNLKCEKESLKEQLKCKVVMEKLLSESLDLKKSELDRMIVYKADKRQNALIEAKNAVIEVKTAELEQKIQKKKIMRISSWV